MNTNVYNVIWADDEIDALMETYTPEDILVSQHIHIIAYAHDGKELEEAIDEHRKFLDAVIIDANFNEQNLSAGSERDTSGFEYSRSLYLLKYRKKIPFFLFTKRSEEMLRERYSDTPSVLEEDFPRHERWFEKDDKEFKKMCEKLRATVDDQNTPEFQIRQKFVEEFEAADLIPGASELLINGLLKEKTDEDDYKDAQYYFNPLRMIWEAIESDCKRRHILPPITQLNSMADYLELDKEVGGFKRSAQVMPATLVQSLHFFLNLTQDGSHLKDDLSLKVIDYVREKKNVNLFRSALYIVMDLLLWYKQVLHNPSLINSWTTIYILVEPAKKTTVEVDGIKKQRYYVDRYSLLPHKNVNGEIEQLREGDLIGVLSDRDCRENKPLFMGRDKFVDKTLRAYKIIERAPVIDVKPQAESKIESQTETN